MNGTKNISGARIGFAAATMIVVVGSASADYFQGFETDTDGWLDFGGVVTRVASGTNGITSATGGFHAEVTIGPGTGDGGFTRFGGYSSVWPGRVIESLDVYIDTAAGAIGDGWFLDNAVNGNDGVWEEAGGVGALKATDGFWWIAADADGGAYPGPAAGGVGLKIIATGWYTIVSDWVANGDGLTVDRDTAIFDSGGFLLYSASDAAQVALVDIGGNRYGWIAGNSPTSMTLAIDNSSLAIPEILNQDTTETFLTIQDAIDDVDTLDGHTLEVLSATHFEGDIHVTKDLSIIGGSVDTIKMTEDTGSSGDDRAWFLVDAGVILDVEDLIFDGNGYLIWQAFRHKGSGSFTNCGFTDIKFNESGPHYSGLAVAAFGDGPVDFTSCTFDEIGRIGVLYFGTGVAGSSYANNTYTGKGDGDWLDYGVELGAGATATISNSTITDNRGVASSDGSTSAGILATTFFGAGTAGTVTSSVLTANTTGIANGFDASDTTVLTANFNSIFGNTSGGISSTSTVVVDAEDNWWGDSSGPADPAGTFEADNPPCFDPDSSTLLDVINADGAGNGVSDGNVDYCPWLLSPGTLSLIPDSTCYGAGVGDTVTVAISMSAVKDFVVGGQFFLDYDKTVLDFVSADPGDPPFVLEVFESVDEPGGTIDYAVGVLGGGPGTASDTDMAVLTFTALTETCGTSGLIGFRAHVPPTRLTNEFGDAIAVLTSDLASVSIDGTPPVITPPGDIEVNADAGGCDAFVTVPALVATDGCSGIDTVVNDFNGTADASDVYPSGTTVVTWTVTDLCGNVSVDSQDVTVNAVNDLSVAVELASVGASVTRCITFELWSCPGTFPVEIVSLDLTFTAGLFVGTIEIPCGDYECITARDTLHTLRRTDDDGDFAIVGTEYVADFTAAGTTDDSLIGGNLNDDFFIDILDFGIFVGQFSDVVGADTLCTAIGPHADISGNGTVFTEDFTFISLNFLDSNEANCCGAPLTMRLASGRAIAFSPTPVTRISAAQLQARGLDDLLIADLNHDGWLDVLDVQAFASGVRP